VRGVLNLEMAATPEMVAIACREKPDVVTLVPEKRQERTTEGGLDVMAKGLSEAVAALGRAGIAVSLFIDPTENAVRASKALGASRIELHTGDYCEKARGLHTPTEELARLVDSARLGASLGLHVAAGHGLDYPNVSPVAAIPEVSELNIGHAIVARAVFVGLGEAVREMMRLMREART
jgi:pyridoxine 5-phosphate synthase